MKKILLLRNCKARFRQHGGASVNRGSMRLHERLYENLRAATSEAVSAAVHKAVQEAASAAVHKAVQEAASAAVHEAVRKNP